MFNCPREECLVKLINMHGLSRGLEVGVRDGDFARLLLKNSCLSLLVGVDYMFGEKLNAVMADYPRRYLFLPGRSPEISMFIPNNSLDFIHIDAAHDYNSVKADLEAWWPKLRNGGLFSGDDYMDYINPHERIKYGVVQAVEEFADTNKLLISINHLNSFDKEEKRIFAKENGLMCGRHQSGFFDKPYHHLCWWTWKINQSQFYGANDNG